MCHSEIIILFNVKSPKIKTLRYQPINNNKLNSQNIYKVPLSIQEIMVFLRCH